MSMYYFIINFIISYAGEYYLLLRMESLRSEYKHALAVALSGFDGGFDGIR